MRVFDVIERKKNRAELTREELRFFCRAVASEEATDSQIAAFCMAVLLNGMTDRECANLTLAMTESGETLPRPQGGGVFADKHSTGGVSDSTTLVLVPVLSALGVKCAKLSGRGLAHTGGTLDKMESFGCRVDLSPEEFEEQVQTIGAAVAGQTKSTVPADKRMYAVRDVTATVDSVPLIASSVMSKKLASFADIILLDVKYGSGAFMKREKDAETLARLMVSIGKTANRRVSAAITRMDSPLGDNVGCNLEARECVEVLKGKRNDLAELSLFHCAKILRAARGVSEEEGLRLAKECIASGNALEQLEKIVRAQGGDGRSVRDETRLPLAKNVREIRADREGWLSVDALILGTACAELGGGRLKEGDEIDHTVGYSLKKRAGDHVKKGEVLALEYSNQKKTALAERAFGITAERPAQKPLVYSFIE
ncbi:thymidine phosphorylase [Candidatus Borkfalkia ceftriaxoniphila]|uniref:Pyrimidine-nucleoside phosphorylase n=1 Tax=Candidatus Borkfalkia ceftriaxoniphila TaxID=2508949 RepID=A0A4Q2KEQ0_9FIRM|nr:thymidine phosphorylase [Candidatus Borkfalkia ceftriaxoniphila]RXZ61962.1 thymidine phosphorylase [Candidatus Borkfalkia ceftriaxoniphila]